MGLAVPGLHSSGFNLPSTLGCGCGHSISRPLGGGGGLEVLSSTKARFICVRACACVCARGLSSSGRD